MSEMTELKVVDDGCGCDEIWGPFQEAGSSMIPTCFVVIFVETRDFRSQKAVSA